MAGEVKKIVPAYSGGLDISVILRWLQETYLCEVVTFIEHRVGRLEFIRFSSARPIGKSKYWLFAL
jgi:argininosuccinate synthase